MNAHRKFNPSLLLALIGGGLAAVTWAACRDMQAHKIQRVSDRAKHQRAAEMNASRANADRVVTKRNATNGTR